jgi:uncharacterized protein
MNAPNYFEIQVDDTSRARRFYEQLFGWEFSREENAPVEYWRIKTSGIRGGLLKRPAKTPPPQHGTNAYVCSIEVRDFDATARQAEALGAQVALPKFAVPGVCWQGYFLDPEGNTFGVFQPDPNAR